MDRVRRLSVEVLDKHRVEFGEDFAENKKALNDLSIIRSKGLKNEIAGYITKMIKTEVREAKLQEAQEKAHAEEEARRQAAEKAAADAAAAKKEAQAQQEQNDADSDSTRSSIVTFDDDDNNNNNDKDSGQITADADSEPQPAIIEPQHNDHTDSGVTSTGEIKSTVDDADNSNTGASL